MEAAEDTISATKAFLYFFFLKKAVIINNVTSFMGFYGKVIVIER
jgi:hypothetical protein